MAVPTSLLAVADAYQAIVFDQWGVLHNGTTPYPGAVEAIEQLGQAGKTLAVLSNSGKRAAANKDRIAAMGLPVDRLSHIMTSGEAFWQDIEATRVDPGTVFPITAKPGDFEAWAGDLSIFYTDTLADAQSIVLMGLPEGGDGSQEQGLLDEALTRGLPVYCTNPDRASPRADGARQISPGALAHAYHDKGGKVTFYGKPHLPVFSSLAAELRLPAHQTLMVGDSLEHDVAGAHAAGWKSAFVTTGLHADAFANTDATQALNRLIKDHDSPPPTHVINRLAD